jgi:hypothetical protein
MNRILQIVISKARKSKICSEIYPPLKESPNNISAFPLTIIPNMTTKPARQARPKSR